MPWYWVFYELRFYSGIDEDWFLVTAGITSLPKHIMRDVVNFQLGNAAIFIGDLISISAKYSEFLKQI